MAFGVAVFLALTWGIWRAQSFIDIPNIERTCLNENSTSYLRLRFRSCFLLPRKICTATRSCGRLASRRMVVCKGISGVTGDQQCRTAFRELMMTFQVLWESKRSRRQRHWMCLGNALFVTSLPVYRRYGSWQPAQTLDDNFCVAVTRPPRGNSEFLARCNGPLAN
jgi:hypothetical protein